MSPLTTETFQDCIESERPHITNPDELEIFNTVTDRVACAGDLVPESSVNMLFAEAEKNRGVYPEGHPLEGQKKGADLRAFVSRYRLVLVATDSTEMQTA